MGNIMVIPDTSRTVKCSGPLLNSLNGAQNLETPLSVRQFFLRFKFFKLQKKKKKERLIKV